MLAEERNASILSWWECERRSLGGIPPVSGGRRMRKRHPAAGNFSSRRILFEDICAGDGSRREARLIPEPKPRRQNLSKHSASRLKTSDNQNASAWFLRRAHEGKQHFRSVESLENYSCLQQQHYSLFSFFNAVEHHNAQTKLPSSWERSH